MSQRLFESDSPTFNLNTLGTAKPVVDDVTNVGNTLKIQLEIGSTKTNFENYQGAKYGFDLRRHLAEDYVRLDYIQSSGTQYIDTGINADKNLKLEMDLNFNSNSGSSYQNTFGAINTGSPYCRMHINPQSATNVQFLYDNNSNIGLINFFVDSINFIK